ncbi:MAG TPA: tRNA lysidine(34) synthetase TilS [Flavobacterium sp.]|nr:tRNA lysidine(34) synthetase TilS [Flavobacterium sp.]
MLSKLQLHLNDNFSFLKGKRLLLAVSGGMDSIVMTDLLLKIGCDIAIAHCNFQLRGIESIDDKMFVENVALENNVPFFTTIFDTEGFAKDYRLSTQVAARELRYNWFYELLDQNGYDYVLTAHHADDNLETFIINLSRGSGIDGLIGIPSINDKIIRPLLMFSRAEIEQYATSNKITWRDDSSNSSDKYLRNKIRHDLVPMLKNINPEFLAAFANTQDYLRQTQSMAEDAAIMVYQQVAQEANGEIHFNLNKLQQLPNANSYLHHWLKEFGFTAWDDIFRLADGDSGKQVFSSNYRLLKNRHFMILSPLAETEQPISYWIEPAQNEIDVPIKLSLVPTDNITNPSNETIFVDADKLAYPLQIRKWQHGDVFYPLGMEGQSKKVSKLFKDEKLSLFQKEKMWLLCSKSDIVWIIGIRPDERFKVGPQTTNILKIALQ